MIYKDTVDIKSTSETPDGSGGFTTTTSARYSSVPCKWHKRSELSTQRKREIMGDTAEINYSYVIAIPVTYSSFAEDDIVTHDSTDYKITGSDTGRVRIFLTLQEK